MKFGIFLEFLLWSLPGVKGLMNSKSKRLQIPSNQGICLDSCQPGDFISQSIKEYWKALWQLLTEFITKAAQNLTPATQTTKQSELLDEIIHLIRSISTSL